MPEEIIHSEYLYRGKIVKLRLDQVRLENHRVVSREVVEHRGAVAIVALDEQKRVLLVRQHRPGAGRELLEIPAGTLEEGEEPMLCATRELKEETGYSALQWENLGYFFPTPGFCTEQIHLLLAQKLTPGKASPEDDELLQIEVVPFAQAMQKIDRGEIVDAKTIIGLMRVSKLIGAKR